MVGGSGNAGRRDGKGRWIRDKEGGGEEEEEDRIGKGKGLEKR